MAPWINNININNNINNNNNIQQTNIYPPPPHPNRPTNEFYPPLENEPQITFDEVQERHGLTARLFVGNLSVTVEQQTLMHDLYEEFRQHGSCYIALKYSRNKLGRQLPGAFVQYERPEHAQAALSMAQKLQLHGRTLRVAMAVGNRHQSASGSQAPYPQVAYPPMPYPQVPYTEVSYPPVPCPPMPYPQVPYTQVAYPPVPCPPMPYPQMHHLQMPPQGYPYQQGPPTEPTSGPYMNPYMAGAPGPYPPVWGEQNYSEQMGYNNYLVSPYPHDWEEQSYPVQVEASNGPVLEQVSNEGQQATDEGLQATDEGLQAADEGLEASDEELQTYDEGEQTSDEELHFSDEELQTSDEGEQTSDEGQQASSESQLEHQQDSVATTWEGPLIVDGSVGSNNESN
ncbi:hypothetical protein BDV38DRAFT_283406 [Aspergillus pseudotamarii]|uniref:RRM domain-containing protein n=1 Tax=Aspergillus pseudotamarii TaxID=132259 RepID=A0A5N6SV65_ASPPS|nr:uncharacterized protein BDV38DRAFT_283406 [Aspergillus pseudotamarii]KAE8137014.1 hypothetical protein BDV38DRAFT_283406 [Aspergillus pseudotamarii]